MSYCRFGKDSDVYVYGSQDFLECCGCAKAFRTKSYSEMINHLKEHVELHGDKVPKRAFDRLKQERELEGDTYRNILTL